MRYKYAGLNTSVVHIWKTSSAEEQKLEIDASRDF